MNAQELRIGNYVDTPQGIKKVSHISLDSDCYFLSDEVCPIPLSKDFMVKLGFINTDDYHEYYRYKHSHWLKVQIFPDGKGIILIDGKQYRFVHYVHEIQNVFFGLIKEELTLNLKP